MRKDFHLTVGNSERSNLLKFVMNNLTGPTSLISSFGPKPGSHAGLNTIENGNIYTAINNSGVWRLIPNTAATGGNYALAFKWDIQKPLPLLPTLHIIF